MKVLFDVRLCAKLLAVFMLVFPFVSFAQCAMCRASLDNEANQTTAEGINDGIVYLMAIPYLLVAAVFYAVYRIRHAKKKQSKV